MWIRSLGRKDPLEEEMATHSSILPMDRGAWRAIVLGIAKLRCDWAQTHMHHHLSQSAFSSLWW